MKAVKCVCGAAPKMHAWWGRCFQVQCSKGCGEAEMGRYVKSEAVEHWNAIQREAKKGRK